MKVTCDVIKDLILIYDEDVSEDTKVLVRDHLTACEECRKYYKQMSDLEDGVEELKNEKPEVERQNKTIKKSFGKIRNRWIASVLIVALLAPVIVFGGRLTFNQAKGEGLRFTNIDEVLLCRNYVKAMEKQDFNKMYNMMDVAKTLKEIKDAYKVNSSDKLLKNFENIELNNEEWCIHKENDNLLNAKKDEMSFWKDVIYENKQGVLIPEAIWNNIAGGKVSEIRHNISGVEYTFYYLEDTVDDNIYNDIYDNPGFICLNTKWGKYYTYGMSKFKIDNETIVTYFDVMIEDANDAISFFWSMDVLPKEIVYEAVEEIEKSKGESLQWLEKEYGDILNMEEEQYIEYVKAQYKTSFENFWNKGYKITDISYIDEDQNVEITSYDETIVMHIEIEDKEGKKESGRLVFAVKDKKIYIDSKDGGGYMMEALYNAMTNEEYAY